MVVKMRITFSVYVYVRNDELSMSCKYELGRITRLVEQQQRTLVNDDAVSASSVDFNQHNVIILHVPLPSINPRLYAVVQHLSTTFFLSFFPVPLRVVGLMTACKDIRLVKILLQQSTESSIRILYTGWRIQTKLE